MKSKSNTDQEKDFTPSVSRKESFKCNFCQLKEY